MGLVLIWSKKMFINCHTAFHSTTLYQWNSKRMQELSTVEIFIHTRSSLCVVKYFVWITIIIQQSLFLSSCTKIIRHLKYVHTKARFPQDSAAHIQRERPNIMVCVTIYWITLTSGEKPRAREKKIFWFFFFLFFVFALSQLTSFFYLILKSFLSTRTIRLSKRHRKVLASLFKIIMVFMQKKKKIYKNSSTDMSEGERKIMYGVVKRSNTRSRLKKGSKNFCIWARERERETVQIQS